MYLEHFGLQTPPFALTPDTRAFFDAGVHREALNVLLVALRSGEGFLKVTGEIGTGKTLLCRRLLADLADEGYVTAYLPNPFVAPNGLRAALADELGLDYPRNLGQHHLLRLINDRLLELSAEGRSVVVVVDEAQSMPDATLEALRLLSNLETEQQKLLQLVLFGQPELDERLAQPALRQLRQRISFSYRLAPLPAELVARYVDHRMRVAGSGGERIFADRALRRLARASGGVPRLVNILGNKALMAAYGEGVRRVQAHHVKAAARDTETVASSGAMGQRLLPGLFAAGVLLVLAGWALWRFGLATGSGAAL
ncbi:AAA family ATPase [Ectothiorhodospiraceae bacterium WFHF3C12]|nr:AAA family ATPase [Ectothiorhodospiraceae bacterium WFHF3C12]